jgi:hypothetical protein
MNLVFIIKGSRLTCVVCGRVFPEGQGIVIRYKDKMLTFHSKSCAVKFFRYYIENVDPSCIDKYINKLIDDFQKYREIKSKKKILAE